VLRNTEQASKTGCVSGYQTFLFSIKKSFQKLGTAGAYYQYFLSQSNAIVLIITIWLGTFTADESKKFVTSWTYDWRLPYFKTVRFLCIRIWFAERNSTQIETTHVAKVLTSADISRNCDTSGLLRTQHGGRHVFTLTTIFQLLSK